MPSIRSFSYRTYLEIGLYVALLFFVIPIKIDSNFEIRQQFLDYIRVFNKTYPDETTFNLRFQAFKKSLENIDLLNANRTNSSALYGLTKFSDLSAEQFKSFYNNRVNTKRDVMDYYKTRKMDAHVSKRSVYWNSVPKIIDWRSHNVVSKVKYQGDCGACWAFAVIETIESMHAIKTHQLTELSVQQMIDCSTYNNGCHGGDTCLLLRWLKDYNVSIANDTEYPRSRTEQPCQKTNLTNGVRIDSYDCVNMTDREDVILKLLADNGPIAVGVNGQTWQNYVGGVIQFHCDGDLSHAVQIVGYNLEAEVPYYIVRNSWGEDFGDNGYLYVAIGSNVCGIASEVAAVTVL